MASSSGTACVCLPNYKPEEDVRLTKAWVSTSNDPLTGNNQDIKTFWCGVSRVFNAAWKEGDTGFRLPSSLSARWSVLRLSLSKFCAAYAKAKLVQRSGWSEEMYVAEAHKIYLVLCAGKPFKSVASWQACRKCPKWTKSDGVCASVADARDERKRKASKSDTEADSTSVATTGSSSATGPRTAGSPRPGGNKKAKAQALRKHREAKRSSYLSSASAMAQANNRKNNLMELQIGMSLFKDNKSADAIEFRTAAKAIMLGKVCAKLQQETIADDSQLEDPADSQATEVAAALNVNDDSLEEELMNYI